ncbi:hypothetical protein Tco_0629502 [Tanacetum coccineum]|uniref:Uncharacterized protein n=1 Tax=Tanacetum coccineum TaxID=301880 RepID=A0ABQ4WTB3_9ASTR
MYEIKLTTIPFPCRLNGYYCEEKKGSYRPQFMESYSKASHINNFIPRKEKVPRSFTLPYFINNVCFDNSLADLRASILQFLDDMDAYRDDGIGDVIFGEPFLREVRINAKLFEGIITTHIGNEKVTYQIVRLNMRFKHHTNEQCNKIPPLLKVSEENKMNEILHSYQKLKGFYKGVLNLGPEYVRDAKMGEWLTCRT